MIEESPVNEMINTSSIGLIGHSFGGITASEIAVVDDRFDAVIAMSHANPMCVDDISIPIQFIGTDFDYGLFSIPMIQLSYSRAKAPKEMIMIKLGTHFGFTTAFNSLCPCPRWQKNVVLHYIIPWFDYFWPHFRFNPARSGSESFGSRKGAPGCYFAIKDAAGSNPTLHCRWYHYYK